MPQQSCAIGIDIGTTNIKTIAVSDDGRELARASADAPVAHPEDGAAESDARVVADRVTEAVAEVAREATRQGYAVTRVGMSAGMHSLLPVGADDAPLGPALLWMDTRASAQAEALWNSPQGKALYERTGAPIHAMLPLAKLLWLRQARPDIFSAAAKFVSLKEYIWFTWFGEWEVDVSIAGATGLYNLREDTWDAEALALTQLTPDRLSRLTPTTYTRQGVRDQRLLAAGVARETRFTIGASDGPLANLGSGATTSEGLALTIGTSLAVRTVSSQPFTDPATRSFCYVLDRATQRYILGGPSNNGGVTLDWLYTHVFGGKGAEKRPETRPAGFHWPWQSLTGGPLDAQTVEGITEAIAAGGQVAPAAMRGLLFLPYLAGERAPIWSTEATGVLLGLDLSHTGAHILRALVEGVLLNAYWIARDVMGLMERSGERPQVVLASGKVLGNEWIQQMTADIFGLPVQYQGAGDASALGAVAIANIAGGVWSWDEARERGRANQRVATPPDPQRHAAYARTFERFRHLTLALTGELADVYFDQQ